jgi:multidrug efflux pump subunit AcrB
MSAKRFNLSALAVRERSITLFLIILMTIAGIYAFFGLGRAEDPPFTVKQMTIISVWPGDRAGNPGSGCRAAGKTPAGAQMV